MLRLRQAKVGNPELEARVIKLVKRAGMPISIEYIAHNLDVSWATARAILLELALNDRIVAEKTSKSWIFRWKRRTVLNVSNENDRDFLDKQGES